VRVLLGSEPFATERSTFASAEAGFTEEVRKYWLEEHGISLRSSAKVVQAIELLDAGRLRVRFVHGRTRLHAKVYVGAAAATVGSSNFTGAGLGDQIEANARFDKDTDQRRYDEVVQVAENLWSIGTSWDDQFRALLMALLRFVSWQEALARACADLLGRRLGRPLPRGRRSGEAVVAVAGRRHRAGVVDRGERRQCPRR
jgi:hypothetical protein